MPSYSKMTIAELRHVCDANGIDHEGLTKRRIIEVLREYDQGLMGSDDEQRAEDSEAEVGGGDEEQSEDGGRVDGSTTPSAGEAAESESVVQLRLQLALVQAKREARIAEIQARREELEIERERIAIQASPQGAAQTTNGDPTAVGNLKLMLPTMSNDDALSFFHAFERTLEINDIERAKWIKFLPAQLSPKALKAFTRLTLEQSRDYDVVKRTVLSYYKLDAHAYIKAFKSQRRTGNETYKMFLNKLSETFAYWQEAKGIESLEMLSDAILADQFLLSLPDNVRSFVSARQPKSAAECADLADLCYEVSMMSASGDPSRGTTGKGQIWATDHNRFGKNGRNVQYQRQGMYDQGGPANYSSRDNAGNFAADKGGYKPKPYKSHGSRPYNVQRSQPQKFASHFCTQCGKHHNPNKSCKQYGVYATNTFDCENVVVKDPYIVPLFLNGKMVSALRDTGNTGPVLVDEKLVPHTAYLPNAFVYCKGVFDKDIKRKIPLAEVKIRSPRFRFNEEVLVRVEVCELPDGIDCNVGNELFQTHPELTDIIELRRDMNAPTEKPDTQHRNETMISHDCDTNSCSSDRTTVARPDDTAQIITRSAVDDKLSQHDATHAADCDDINNLTGISTDHKQQTSTASERGPDNDLNKTLSDFGQIDINDMNNEQAAGRDPVAANNFQHSQRADPSLASLWTRAEAGSHEYRIISDTLYKVSPANNSGSQEFLLVVPAEYRSQLLRLAHDVPCSGHQGIRNTEKRLKALFSWPKMQAMIRNYVRSCKTCQMVAARQSKERQPLQPLEIMATHAFDDISIDIMGGQLPVSAKGNKYLLLIVCNTSKWVHGFALRNLRAETITDKLIEFFCLYGIPRIIRSDNFATFHSQLLTKVREKLGVDAKFSNAFHFQSHGTIERVNLTVENMLRKFIHENPKRWDELLPLLLFALREVPHSSQLQQNSYLVVK